MPRAGNQHVVLGDHRLGLVALDATAAGATARPRRLCRSRLRRRRPRRFHRRRRSRGSGRSGSGRFGSGRFGSGRPVWSFGSGCLGSGCRGSGRLGSRRFWFRSSRFCSSRFCSFRFWSFRFWSFRFWSSRFCSARFWYRLGCHRDRPGSDPVALATVTTVPLGVLPGTVCRCRLPVQLFLTAVRAGSGIISFANPLSPRAASRSQGVRRWCRGFRARVRRWCPAVRGNRLNRYQTPLGGVRDRLGVGPLAAQHRWLAILGGTDGVNQLALAHGAGAFETECCGKFFQFGQDHCVQPTSPCACALPRSLRRWRSSLRLYQSRMSFSFGLVVPIWSPARSSRWTSMCGPRRSQLFAEGKLQ